MHFTLEATGQISDPIPRAAAGLVNPNEIQRHRICDFALPDIGGNKGDDQTRGGLKCEGRGQVQGIERPQSGSLGQFLGLMQDDFTDFHKFPIATVFAESRPDRKAITLGEFTKRASPVHEGQDLDWGNCRREEPILLQ